MEMVTLAGLTILAPRLQSEADSLARAMELASSLLLSGLAKVEGKAELERVLQQLQQEVARMKAVADEREQQALANRSREIEVSWFGVAQEVRLMGTFDEWTLGEDLSPESVLDSVFTRFTATLRLRPGRHLVKFLVDGEWRLAPDWPIDRDAEGVENNVLLVE